MQSRRVAFKDVNRKVTRVCRGGSVAEADAGYGSAPNMEGGWAGLSLAAFWAEKGSSPYIVDSVLELELDHRPASLIYVRDGLKLCSLVLWSMSTNLALEHVYVQLRFGRGGDDDDAPIGIGGISR